ncbi:SNF2 family N-terminal domain-containing protein [Rhypophila decipiens]|uniref:SNF2 family N-terminal domain-containing protein n=1 Tax=Rhypophila decipiens TaxID=261697 RepID=A0AAN6Y881_9PEZI|nr:SNF2 family N-terminal domain-containing protein [Rhypophila decipiens]
MITASRRFSLFNIVRSDGIYTLSTQSDTIVAHLDLATGHTLKGLEGLQQLGFRGVVDSTALSNDQKGDISRSINVYGPFSEAHQIGEALSSASAFLQHPFYLVPSCSEYFNPQMFRAGAPMQDLTHLVGLTEKDLMAKAISDGVQHILESLDGSPPSDISGFKDDWEPQGLLSDLNRHQVLALKFVQRRESHSYCYAMRQKLRHFMNISTQDNNHSYCTGGILADVMGLGKTLTMISTILSTLTSSRHERSSTNDGIQGPGIGATLVVVTSVQVLHVWETEIAKHVKYNTLRTCRFHGRNRPTSADHLRNFDIVLTTYSTLSADAKNRGVLHEVDWYRIVLDEAHWIRNQGPRQFKTAVSLKSIRRWCLTGTPIQNSLNDLNSLLGFLHFEPFASPKIFSRYILEPLSNETENGYCRLRELLRTICLRREASLLNLPEPQFERVEVALQQEERALYDRILARCARDIDEIVSSRSKIKKYGIMFAAMMKLRRLCNHGTFATSLLSNTLAGDLPGAGNEQGCDFCNGADEDMFELVKQDSFCSECGRDLMLKASPGVNLPSLNEYVDTPMSEGVSSKAEAVLNRLNRIEDGSKSLVFSYWTATLDLLEHHLKAQGTSYSMIDGNVPYAARLRILEDFRHNEVPVLLMTVETGAFGLNLTAANYVHIVEPQWNPTVEEQAIARAVRMGQTRTVTVVRYMVKDSIEEQYIFQLQRRKRNLAKFTLEGVSQQSGTLDVSTLISNLPFGLTLIRELLC